MKRIVSFAVLLLMVIHVWAIPIKPVHRTITLKDGRHLTYTPHGDDRIAWAVTEDGYTVLRNRNGVLVYAIIDQTGNMVPGAVAAVDSAERTAEEILYVSQLSKGLFFNETQIHLPTPKSPLQWNTFPHTGTDSLLVVLVNFTDTTFTHSRSQMNAMFNQQGWNGTGSVRDYYRDQSHGQLELAVRVVGPVTVSHNKAYYNGYDSDGNPIPYHGDANSLANEVRALVADSIEENHFSGGDGNTAFLTMVYAGDKPWDNSYCLWPHQWGRNLIANEELHIGTFCHEFGHLLGLPDMYDADYEANGQADDPGIFSLMASGNYNIVPPSLSVYEKYLLDWGIMDTLTSASDSLTLPVVGTDAEKAYYISLDGDEFLMMEARTTGCRWDEPLGVNGIMIWHGKQSRLNSWIANGINTVNTHAADPGWTLLGNGVAVGDGGVWPSNQYNIPRLNNGIIIDSLGLYNVGYTSDSVMHMAFRNNSQPVVFQEDRLYDVTSGGFSIQSELMSSIAPAAKGYLIASTAAGCEFGTATIVVDNSSDITQITATVVGLEAGYWHYKAYAVVAGDTIYGTPHMACTRMLAIGEVHRHSNASDNHWNYGLGYSFHVEKLSEAVERYYVGSVLLSTPYSFPVYDGTAKVRQQNKQVLDALDPQIDMETGSHRFMILPHRGSMGFDSVTLQVVLMDAQGNRIVYEERCEVVDDTAAWRRSGFGWRDFTFTLQVAPQPSSYQVSAACTESAAVRSWIAVLPHRDWLNDKLATSVTRLDADAAFNYCRSHGLLHEIPAGGQTAFVPFDATPIYLPNTADASRPWTFADNILAWAEFPDGSRLQEYEYHNYPFREINVTIDTVAATGFLRDNARYGSATYQITVSDGYSWSWDNSNCMYYRTLLHGTTGNLALLGITDTATARQYILQHGDDLPVYIRGINESYTYTYRDTAVVLPQQHRFDDYDVYGFFYNKSMQLGTVDRYHIARNDYGAVTAVANPCSVNGEPAVRWRMMLASDTEFGWLTDDYIVYTGCYPLGTTDSLAAVLATTHTRLLPTMQQQPFANSLHVNPDYYDGSEQTGLQPLTTYEIDSWLIYYGDTVFVKDTFTTINSGNLAIYLDGGYYGRSTFTVKSDSQFDYPSYYCLLYVPWNSTTDPELKTISGAWQYCDTASSVPHHSYQNGNTTGYPHPIPSTLTDGIYILYLLPYTANGGHGYASYYIMNITGGVASHAPTTSFSFVDANYDAATNITSTTAKLSGSIWMPMYQPTKSWYVHYDQGFCVNEVGTNTYKCVYAPRPMNNWRNCDGSTVDSLGGIEDTRFEVVVADLRPNTTYRFVPMIQHYEPIDWISCEQGIHHLFYHDWNYAGWPTFTTQSCQVYGTADTTLCYGATFANQTFVTNGTATITLPCVAATGCDSVISYNVYVLPQRIGRDSVTLCYGEEYDGRPRYASTTLTHTIAEEGQCDSTVSIRLNVLPQRIGYDTMTLCYGEEYDGEPRYSSTTITHTYPEEGHCDTTVRIRLVVRQQIKTTVHDTLWDETYIWGDTVITTIGTYIHVFTSLATGCDSTVTLYLHEKPNIGIDAVETIMVKIYQCEGKVVVEGADGIDVTLYDAAGRMLAVKQSDNQTITFDVPASGTYLVKIGDLSARKIVVVK